ncbi:MAG: bifunctional glutamate N-acetyltransferase/amino-acid acetyltransferase ArgJ [bacterium]
MNSSKVAYIPSGFNACAVKNPKLSLFFSSRPCAAAGVFTKNLVQAAPVMLSRKHIRSGYARAILINSGCANAATGKKGLYDALISAQMLAKDLQVKPHEILLASTGVIGTYLNMKQMSRGISNIVKKIHIYGRQPRCFDKAARSIMTTDTFPKIVNRKLTIPNSSVIIWGCAKGAGMIHPDMATMLSVFLTDAAVMPETAQALLQEAAARSFNKISVDGDTSTNDTVYLLANGGSGGKNISPGRAGFTILKKNLIEMSQELAAMIASDGEGARHLIKLRIEKARNASSAEQIARTVAASPLVKTAIYGGDPNWGRVLAAVGRAGVLVDPDKITIYFGRLKVCHRGHACMFSKSQAKNILRKKEVLIRVILNQGSVETQYLTCDLTEKYIKINAKYTT